MLQNGRAMNSHRFHVFVGDTDESLAQEALSFDSNAILLTGQNVDAFLCSNDITTVYTSLGDMPKDLNIFWAVLQKADIIHYCPPLDWIKKSKNQSLYNITDNVRGLTEQLIIQISYSKKVIGFDLINPLAWTSLIPNKRLSNDICLFTAGCSITYGNGVDKHQAYGSLLSKRLNLPHVQLALPGTSLTWQSDQILRSDIKKDDILVWGLTNPIRFSCYHNFQLLKLNPQNYATNKEYNDILPLKYVLSEDNLHKNLSCIESITNFCKKIGVKLFMFEAMPNNPSLIHCTCKNDSFHYIRWSNKNFDPTTGYDSLQYMDLGNDNLHPGVKQHEFWYKQLLNIIKKELDIMV